MNNANKKIFIKKLAIFSIVGAMAIGQVTLASIGARVNTHAAASSPSKVEYVDNTVYCDDPVYSEMTDDEPSFQGQGAHTDGTYRIECDEMVTLTSTSVRDVPSFGSSNSEWNNACGPVAGLNVVVFYDRYSPNLVPNYNPGVVVPVSGVYHYFPDIANVNTENALESLYDLMDVANVGGTTAANFQSGLVSFVQSAGYSVTYTSMHQNSATVNLSALTNAINQNKVGLVMCSQYNFVYSMQMGADGTYASVGKIHSSVGHIMMVYGYKTVGFYKEGNLVATKTFLNVCSGYSTCEKGWMELNDSAVINNALVVSIA